jgi:hypothetical protein
MALSSKHKKILIFTSIIGAGGLAFLLFKKGSKLEFVDNVYCTDESCSNVNPDSYVGDYSNADGDEGNGTGMVNLLFTNKHNLSAGDNILVTQTSDSISYPEYDGWRIVQYVYNDYVVRLDIPRMGSSPIEGGFVQKEALSKRLF